MKGALIIGAGLARAGCAEPLGAWGYLDGECRPGAVLLASRPAGVATDRRELAPAA